MRILKFFLYTILSTCILWALLVLAGPRLIELSIKMKFGDTINLSDVEVSPRLSVRASRVNVSNLVYEGINISEGSARAVELGFEKLFSGAPVLNLSGSFVKIDEAVALGSFSARVQLKTNFDFNDLLSEVAFEDLRVADKLRVDRAIFDAELDTEALAINDLGLQFHNIVSIHDYTFRSDYVDGSFDRLEIFNNPPFFDTSFDLEFNDVTIENNDLELTKVNNIIATGNTLANLLNINVEAGNSTFSNGLEISNSSLNVSVQDVFHGLTSLDAKFVLNDLLLPRHKSTQTFNRVKKMTGSYVHDAEETGQVSMRGNLGDFEVFWQDQIVADISGANVTLEGNIVDQNQAASIFSLSKEDGEEAKLTVMVSVNDGRNDLIACFLNQCETENLTFGYSLDVGGDELVGRAQCKGWNCFGTSSAHTLRTSNTNAFFQNLVQTKILNPLVLGVLYNNFLSAEKVGTGNVLNF